jgi:hypothetical protein
MIVYWSPYEKPNQKASFMSYFEPVLALSIVMSEQTQNPIDRNENLYKNCPAFRDFWHNVFALKLTHDYTLEFDDERVWSNNFTQEFFDDYIMIRSVKDRMFTIQNLNLFVCEEPLEISIMSAHFEDNNFVNGTRIIPGQFDIGKWFRPLECAFFAKKGVKKIDMKAGDVFCYVKFHSKEKVTIKRFHANSEIKELISDAMMFVRHKKLGSPMVYFYEKMKHSGYKKKFIRIVKSLTEQ